MTVESFLNFGESLHGCSSIDILQSTGTILDITARNFPNRKADLPAIRAFTNVNPQMPDLREFIHCRLNAIRFFVRLIVYVHVTARLFSPKNLNKLRWTKFLLLPEYGRKIFRPYLARRFGRGERLRALIDHYSILHAEGLLEIFKGHAEGNELNLAQFSGKSKLKTYELSLAQAPGYYPEGELILRLKANSVVLYSIGFSFLELAGERYLYLGCLQGGRMLKSDIGSATRDLFGSCPKFFSIAVLRGIATHFKCTGVLLVNNANRVCTTKSTANLFADYDETWKCIGAQAMSTSEYLIPCSGIVKTDFSDVPSKKRSEAKRKAALVSSSIETIRGMLTAARIEK